MQILFATQNRQKQREVSDILSDGSIEVVFPQDIAEVEELDPDEVGDSFEANALLKAKAFAQASKIVSVSDDSGLEVMALDGQPGIHSKRFASGSDHDRNVKLLSMLGENKDRSARFVSVLCLFDPTNNEHIFFEGVVTGEIAIQIAGVGGFGYDPIFIPDGYDQTFGQLGNEIKNAISHRRRSLIKLHQYLLEQTTPIES